MVELEIPIEIEAAEDDEPAFLTMVEELLQREIETSDPNMVYIVNIDNWFGKRWLGFMGKVFGAAGVHRLTGRHMETITIPPFHPHRVRRVGCWSKEGNIDEAVELHGQRSSEEAMRRTLKSVSESAVFLWYSGSTASNDRGSVMVYVQSKWGATGQYFGYSKGDSEWCKKEEHYLGNAEDRDVGDS